MLNISMIWEKTGTTLKAAVEDRARGRV